MGEFEGASCSFTKDVEMQDEDLTELTLKQGISVWGENQQILEQQALQELNILTQQNPTANEVEDEEILESRTNTSLPSLDINTYIKRQEELRKIQEYKKTLRVDTKSKLIADKISNKYKERKKRKNIDKKDNTEKKIRLEEISKEKANSSGSEYLPSEIETESETEHTLNNQFQQKRKKIGEEVIKFGKIKDDGCLEYFKMRLEEYYKHLEETNNLEDDDPDSLDYYTIKGGLKIPIRIWCNLYTYQQEGIRWLWNIHRQSTGGLLGDEMGLGKTVQVIAFLAGLEFSQVISYDRFKGLGPTLIVCPATVIHQWVKHFHDWAPEFRVAVLHQSGSFQGKKSNLIKEMIKNKGILITSYNGILKYKDYLSDYEWHYLILDEGHKIRNPNAKVSIAVKRIRTPHRLMLTGSPMQNNLQELWSLFDFTNPGMLGNQNTFIEHFNNPIVQGGFMNATPLQEATALSVATTLKNLITPYLLRRSKDEVQHHISLPNKSEQVLFCSLTKEQRELYQGYLLSDHVGFILGRSSKNWFSEGRTRCNVFIAITALRKICNHPDIYLNEAGEQNVDEDDGSAEDKFGHYKKSGKMIVVSALLKIWKKQQHRVLLFTQSRAMIKVFEEFLTQQQYKYLKMDGSTAVSSRQTLINKFNEDSSYDVFLLTTRVGGLGVNLTGADRVIIYDPDWNPATDTQARERAWRIGQNKQVTIYRLLSAGTIEEKMYQRQVWKQLLSNKVLLDPKTHKFFKSSSLHDLFSLPEDTTTANPETTNIFRESRVKLQEKMKESEKQKKTRKKDSFQFSEDKIQAMKKLAQEIAKNMTKPQGQEIKKTSEQEELEKEKEKRLEEKQRLKKLTPMELRILNREKARETQGSITNQVDGSKTDLSFANALQHSETNAKLYHGLKGDRIKKVEEIKKKTHKKKKVKSVMDNSGTIDGEKVDGLIKTEIKNTHTNCDNINKNDNQDQYILEKLFARKGVSGALQHDSVISGGIKKHGLKVQTEAQLKADKALEAIRKSRLSSWRW